MAKKLCFVDLTLETAQELKEIINDGYVLTELPTKPELKYNRFDGFEKIVKLTKCKIKITKEKTKECTDAFKEYNKGEGDHLLDEVGKLICITGGTLSRREEQLFILKKI